MAFNRLGTYIRFLFDLILFVFEFFKSHDGMETMDPMALPTSSHEKLVGIYIYSLRTFIHVLMLVDAELSNTFSGGPYGVLSYINSSHIYVRAKPCIQRKTVKKTNLSGTRQIMNNKSNICESICMRGI